MARFRWGAGGDERSLVAVFRSSADAVTVWGIFQGQGERVSKRLLVFLCGLVAPWFAGLALAAEVALVGVIGERAILVVNGGRPQTVAVGRQTAEGVKVLAVRGDTAQVEFDGVREQLRLGERVVHQTPTVREALRVQADAQGHFWLSVRFNGSPVQRSVVDTGATLVSMGRSAARQAGIDYLQGEEGMSLTANGPVKVWRVRIDALDLGGIVVHNVEAAVHEGELPVVLLGMSLLNRLNWERDAGVLVLSKRY